MRKSYRIFFYQLPLNEHYYSQHIIPALRKLGHTVAFNDGFKAMSQDDLITFCRSFAPDFVIMYGFTFQTLLLSQFEPLFCDELKLPHVTIFTDNPLRYLFCLKNHNHSRHLITCCDSELVQILKDEGYAKTVHLPLFFSETHAYPRQTEAWFTHDLAFAATFLSWETVRKNRVDWSRGMHVKADDVLDIRRKNPGHYVNYFKEFKKRVGDQDLPSVEDLAFYYLCSQNVLEQKYLMRREILESIGKHPLHIYGTGTESFSDPQITHHGYLDQNTELPVLYSSARINLCTELHPVNVHQRIFEIAGCGGFCISEYKKEIETLFDYGNEAICYRSLDELESLIDYYLKHDTERLKIAANSRERALKCHTADRRMTELMTLIEEQL